MIRPGTRIGPYEIISLLGAGGMGEVFKAHDERLDRDVAIKVLPADLIATQDSSRRFEREAKAIAALSHPNILSIYDYGNDQERPYIVTELLHGRTLRAVIGGGALVWKRAAAIARAVSEGLAAAHARGIIHRDLKPENVFITVEDRVKILDFGLARMPESPAWPDADGETLTRPGTVMGTVGYMSPEQASGEKTHETSDIFSLGCIFYEMLTGRPPFVREKAADTFVAILREDPLPIGDLVGGVPEGLVALINRCLEKEPRRRVQSAHDFGLALTDVLEHATEPLPKRATASSPPPATSLLRGAFLLAGIVAIVVLARYRSGHAPDPVRPRISSLAVLPFVNASGDPKLDYLGDGITETVINNLSPVVGLKVMSRNSAFFYKGKHIVAQELWSDLGVEAVVTGRVVEKDDELVVSVELVDAQDDRQVWGERYDRKLANLSEIERDLSRQISDRLKVTLTGEDELRLRRESTVNPEAHRLYLQGRYALNLRTPDGMKTGIRFFEQAAEKDPSYAPAYGAIAEAYLLLGGVYEVMPPNEAMPRARAAAEKALSLDESLADVHACLGMVEHEFYWDWKHGEEELKRAVSLNPNSSVAHRWYGQSLGYRGRFLEAEGQLARAVDLDPLSLVAKSDQALLAWEERNPDLAISRSRKILELDPNDVLGNLLLGLAFEEKGDFKSAIASLEKAKSLYGMWAVIGGLGHAYARSGRQADADHLISGLQQLSVKRYVPATPFIFIYLGLRNYDQALRYIGRAMETRTSYVIMMQAIPQFDAIRSDARYRKYMEQVGLPYGPR
jgi:serine/threonine protein kinase/tetratricopeptide (TPR) repeat protein